MKDTLFNLVLIRLIFGILKQIQIWVSKEFEQIFLAETICGLLGLNPKLSCEARPWYEFMTFIRFIRYDINNITWLCKNLEITIK